MGSGPTTGTPSKEKDPKPPNGQTEAPKQSSEFNLLLGPHSDSSKNLLDACMTGNLESVQTIFQELHGDPEFHATITGRLSISMDFACSYGHADIVTYLLENGAVMGNAAMSAVWNEDTDGVIRVIEVLLKYGLDLAKFPAIIHNVIARSDQTLLRYLLSKGADPNGLDEFETFPLDICGDNTSIGLLIDAGANVNAANLYQDAVSFIDDESCFERLQYLLERGIDINSQAVYAGIWGPGTHWYKVGMRGTANEGTALHWAVRGFAVIKTKPDINLLPRVKWLLDHGANAEIEDNVGKKAIDYAKSQAMIDLLKGYGSSCGISGQGID
ncbi:hypothetical protein G7Y89_g1958 [Cudoniella acicularis]|uniref:Ankyrin n=1 Tax=Cudoniella acicularis TaxID=354080 RepID=A0A8H4RV27_9HELO|nr:hypothetical protein G7Y89_g1958 [Cudoniella acicularis]